MKKSMRSPRKGRHDFTDRLIAYAIEGGVLARCDDHPGSVFRTGRPLSDAMAIVEKAWQTGEISSGLDGANRQLSDIFDKAPDKCSFVKCWSKP